MVKKIAIDTNVLVYLLRQGSEFQTRALQLFQMAGNGLIDLVGSELLLMEVLSYPVLNDKMVDELEIDIRNMPIRLLPINSSVLRQSAGYGRKTPRLKTPDAIHVATAVASGAGYFVTNDNDILKLQIPHLTTVDLSEDPGTWKRFLIS